jgi:sodium/hydrogen exchanger-like protein 6/7
VSLLFCGITLKHYAYFNMSRRTQLTTKYMFQVLAQLSENFIFIYLGLSLFTDNTLVFKPPLIIITVVAVCAARYVAVFPLSRLINSIIRYRARHRAATGDVGEELPYSYQAMLFWAGLRGAVGVALAALLDGATANALRATVLVVVVLTVIIFGGTTARMLEILGIKTGVVDEVDSDDEFDIESFGGGNYYKRTGSGIGYNPRRNGGLSLGQLDTRRHGEGQHQGYASGHRSPNAAAGRTGMTRKNSKGGDDAERTDLLGRSSTTNSDIDSDIDTSDLPPPARRSPRRRSSPMAAEASSSAFRQPSPQTRTQTDAGHSTSVPTGAVAAAAGAAATATSAIRQLLTAEDPSVLFRQFDEDFIKPTLLLDSGSGGGSGSGGRGGPSGNGGAGAGAGPSGSS